MRIESPKMRRQNRVRRRAKCKIGGARGRFLTCPSHAWALDRSGVQRILATSTRLVGRLPIDIDPGYPSRACLSLKIPALTRSAAMSIAPTLKIRIVAIQGELRVRENPVRLTSWKWCCRLNTRRGLSGH